MEAFDGEAESCDFNPFNEDVTNTDSNTFSLFLSKMFQNHLRPEIRFKADPYA